MELYISFAALLFMGANLSLQNKTSERIENAYTPIAILIISAWAYSAGAGTDYIIYKDFFETLKTDLNFQSLLQWWEPGFIAYSLPFIALDASYDTLVFFAVLTSLLLCGVAYKITSSSGLAAFIFSLYCLSIGFIPFIRQDLAAAIAFLAFSFLLKDKKKLFATLAIISFLVHKSAIFPLAGTLIVFSYQSKRATRAVLFTLLAAFAAILAYLLLSPERIETQISVYFTDEFTQGFGDAGLSLFRNYLKFIFLVLAASILYFLSLKRHGNSSSKAAYAVILILSATSFILVYFSPVFARNAIFIFPFLAMLYAQASSSRDMQSIVIAYLIGTGFVIFLFLALKPVIDYM